MINHSDLRFLYQPDTKLNSKKLNVDYIICALAEIPLRIDRNIRLHSIRHVPMRDGQVQLMEMSQRLALSFFPPEIQFQLLSVSKFDNIDQSRIQEIKTIYHVHRLASILRNVPGKKDWLILSKSQKYFLMQIRSSKKKQVFQLFIRPYLSNEIFSWILLLRAMIVVFFPVIFHALGVR